MVTILEVIKEKLFMTPDKVGKEDFIYRGAAVVFCSRGQRSGSSLITSKLQGEVSGWKMTGGDIRAGGCLLDQLNRTLLEASQTDQIRSVGGLLFN